MPISNALASVPVRDLQSTVEWYEKLIGRAADSTSLAQVAQWNFEGGGGLQLYQNRDRAGAGSVTLTVTDIDEQIAELTKSGVDPGAPMRGPTLNVVMIKDPDGNSIAFTQTLDSTTARGTRP